MRRLTTIAISFMLGLAISVAAPGTAVAAAGEFGNACQLDSGPDSDTYVMTGSAPTGLPVSAPSSGVITKARFNVAVGSVVAPTYLKAVRATGNPNQFTVVAQSEIVTVTGGLRSYDVRVPVAAGDLLGLHGSFGTMRCPTISAQDTVASIPGNSQPGTTATYTPQTNLALPVVATVEPDLDGDGYGDITQDGCPQSASRQAACPVVRLDSVAIANGKGINVLVTTDQAVQVQVTGSAKVNGKRMALKSVSQAVVPGTLGTFKVKLPKALRKALAALPSRKGITVTLVASHTDFLGRSTADPSRLKLPGTG
jgi:hypothetical protein